MNRYIFVLPLLLAATLPLPAAASQQATPVIEEGAVGEVVTLTAKIEAVDQAKRTVVVQGPLGGKTTLKVGKDVKNFAEVKVGDNVVLKYYESVALELTKGGQGMLTTETTVAGTAPAGGKPGGYEVNRITMDANVKKVDRKKHMVLVQGPEGRFAELKIKDPAMIKNVKVGDQVHAIFTEGLVIDVVKK